MLDGYFHDVRSVVRGGKLVDRRTLFRMVLGTIFVLSTTAAVALGRNDPAAGSAMTDNGEGSLLSFSETIADLSQGAGADAVNPSLPGGLPRWTASAEFIAFERVGTSNQLLVSTYPVTPPPTSASQLILGQGTDRLFSGDLTQGFAGGPKIGLIRHDENGYDLELSFFQIDGWYNAASVASGPNTTPVFVAPGGFVQTTDSSSQYMEWMYATRLYNAELNVRWDLCPRVTMLAGFRWVGLREELQGNVLPLTTNRTGPFWDTKTTSNLYGLQLGEEWKIYNRGPFSIDGQVKAGVFDNVAEETTGVSIFRTVYWEGASTNQAAFLGEIGLRCKYQVTERLMLKAGYEAMWLQGVALAPGQIPRTRSYATSRTDVSVWALGIDSSAGVFYHGATVGLEYAF